MGKKEKEVMNESAIGSTFEISLRILLMLNQLSPQILDERQIEMIDFISVYAADFGLLDENLHGYGDYRYSEFPARKQPVAIALKNLVLDGYIKLNPTPVGYKYSILETGKEICNKLTSIYAGEYNLAVQTVANHFKIEDSSSMLREINRFTTQSLTEVKHE